MLNALQSVSIIVGSMAVALMTLFVCRKFWLPRAHAQHNDVIGWQVAFLGTTYAVIIAFMLADVWQTYEAAQTNAESEANSMLNLHRLAKGFPSPQQEQLQTLTRQYGELMISDEWPAMQRGTFSSAAFQNVAAIWNAVLTARPATPSEEAALQRALADLASMTEHRRIRHLNSRSGLPVLFWLLLITGGAMTVLYTCLFDVEHTGMHVLQVVCVTFIVSLVLLTIADVDGPYGGALRIQPTGFVTALQSMDRAPQ